MTTKGETEKAYERRLREGWFEKYTPADKAGIDIGCGEDPLNHTFRRYDQIFGDKDATFLEGIPNATFWTVYASHVLEHLSFPAKAIQRWHDVLKPEGFLIIIVPHRDLYERKKVLPSWWNPDHKYFWLPEEQEPPCTKSLKHEVLSVIPKADIVELRTISDGYDFQRAHPVGEYSIEIIVRKSCKL